MKRKNKNNVMLLIALSFFALTTVQPVNAEDEQSVESIIEQIQEHNEREEDIREELKNLSLNELESVDEYLSSKPDITMDENQILTFTQELLSNGSSVNYVAQENLKKAERKETLRLEAEKIVDGLSKEERNFIRQELKIIKDKSTEEKVMYDVLNKMNIVNNFSYILIRGAVLIAVGIAFKMYYKWKGDIAPLSHVFGATFITTGVILIALALNLLI